MTATAELERRYRRWLRLYPATFRREHEAEILDVLMTGVTADRRRPTMIECLDLAGGALRIHLRPRVPRSDRTVVNAIRLVYLGALAELAAAVTILATTDGVRARAAELHPGLSEAEWRAVMASQVQPTAVAAFLAVGLWLWIAWSLGRGRRWTGITLAIFLAVNTYGLFSGLAHGSAMYARADLAVGTVVWLVHLAAVAVLAGHRCRAKPPTDDAPRAAHR
jgi:hypothetical protein